MSQYTLFAVGLLCLVQLTSADYGVQNNNYDHSGNYEDVYENQNGYGNNNNKNDGYENNYDKHDDYDHKCKDIKSSKIRDHTSTHATIREFERHGKTYIRISCKNNNRPYALLAFKNGEETTINGITLKDKALLGTGYNFDFVAECHHGRRVVGTGVNGERYSLKKVSCLQLSAPSPIVAL